MPQPPIPSSASQQHQSNRFAEFDEARPYVVVGDLGKGSFATVYKGYHEETHQQVAVKTVTRDKLSAKLFDNLQSEIQILKSLSHRHITKLIDIVRAERHIYIILEYCSGGDLTNYIKKRGRVESLEYIPAPGSAPQYYPHPRTGGLDEIVVRSFLRQLARALKFLRHRNLIHRDIKPQNLLLTPASPEELARGHPLGVPILKVADFGFARSLPNAMLAETLCGSPLYMAPEILRYEKYGPEADLWSVGGVLYEMSVGKPPFRAQNHIELLKKIEISKGIKFPDEDPTSAAARSGGGGSGDLPVPEDIKALIRALLKANPKERCRFDEFFGSLAMVKSKFPRPPPTTGGGQSSKTTTTSPLLDRNGNVVGGASGMISAQLTRTAEEAAAAERQKMWENGRRTSPPGGQNNISYNNTGVVPSVAGGHVDVAEANAMIPPSKFNFRRASGTPEAMDDVGPSSPVTRGRASPGPQTGTPVDMTRRVSTTGGRRLGKPIVTEESIIPGETEEDGFLRREYVLVGDTRAVEFNRTVDEITIPDRRKPLHDRRIPPTPSGEEYQPEYPIPPSSSSNTTPTTTTSNATTTANTTFPPPPHPGAIPTLSSSPSSLASRAATNALNRALSIASKKLFGHSRGSPSSRDYGTAIGGVPPSPRLRQLPTLGLGEEDGKGVVGGLQQEGEERDPLEDRLLSALEELAQKMDVLTRWADEMYEYVKAVPQKPLADPSKFTKRDGEPEKHARRRKNADIEAEYNAVTCVAVYLLLMSFSQKGINQLRNYQEHLKMRHPDGDFVVSEGFADALSWFKDHFVKCNGRAELVKTWLPAQYDGPKSWLDQLVYDRALVLGRSAARKELLDQATTPDECVKLYEESLWCLYALQDDLLQSGNPFMDEDRETIATWIKRTNLRLVRCRARMAMNDQDRLNDARADPNLADVARIPVANWETKPRAATPS